LPNFSAGDESAFSGGSCSGELCPVERFVLSTVSLASSAPFSFPGMAAGGSGVVGRPAVVSYRPE